MFEGFSEYGKSGFSGIGEYFEDTGTVPDTPLIELLNLNDKNLKPFTKNLLDSNELSEDVQSLLTELSRGINALFQFQDILDISLDPDDSDVINRHYPYFESLVYLRESVVSWLDRNVLAALTLLRPFLELSVLHIYWFLQCRERNYKPYYDWLKQDKGKPSFRDALDYVFDNVPAKVWVTEQRLQELKQVISNSYKTLCAYNHTPKMDESITAKSEGFGNVSLEVFYYYFHIVTILLRQVVYLFILTYPMSLFPIEKHTKWGFGGPVGLFFDKINYTRLETYIGSENITTLKQALSSMPYVESLIEWVDSFPTLTLEEIDADWERLGQDEPYFKKPDVNNLFQRLAFMKGYNRSLTWAMNYIVEHTQDVDIPNEVIEKIRKQVRNW